MVLASVSVCICLSITSQCSIKTAKRIELDFGTRVSFHLFYSALKENSGISKKNKGTSHWNFVTNSGLGNYASAYRSSKKHVIDLARQNERSEREKLDGRSSVNWVDNTSELSRSTTSLPQSSVYRLVAWHSGRTSVSDWRTFPVLRSTCRWWVTTNVGKPSATDQPTRPTQPFILSGSINE